jgi:homocysteine S-methyltransferase
MAHVNPFLTFSICAEFVVLVDKQATLKPIVVYPNSGEQYDPSIKQWVESTGVSDTDFVSYVSEWRDAGAQLIGGCCRTTPTTIQAISNALHESLHLHTTT